MAWASPALEFAYRLTLIAGLTGDRDGGRAVKLSLTTEQHLYRLTAATEIAADAMLARPAPLLEGRFSGPSLGVRLVDERPVRRAPIVVRPTSTVREMSRWAEVVPPAANVAPATLEKTAQPLRRNGSLSELLAAKRGAGVRPALAAR